MRQDTKTALLDTAEQAARARGFDGFSYADLAEAVGIRKASVHYHFPTKAGLSDAMMARYHATMSAALDEITETHQKAAHQLLGLVSHYRVALHDGTRMCLCVALTTSHDSLPAPVQDQLVAFREMVIGWTRQVFERARSDQSIANVADPAQEAHATLALLEGAHVAARASEDVRVFDRAVALLKSRC